MNFPDIEKVAIEKSIIVFQVGHFKSATSTENCSQGANCCSLAQGRHLKEPLKMTAEPEWYTYEEVSVAFLCCSD